MDGDAKRRASAMSGWTSRTQRWRTGRRTAAIDGLIDARLDIEKPSLERSPVRKRLSRRIMIGEEQFRCVGVVRA